MNKAETAAWAAKRVLSFARDLAYVAPELYDEKFVRLSKEIEYQILRIDEVKNDE